MVTEIHPRKGQVEVRSAETERWRPATPLLTLREGDTVNTTQDAWAVIVLTGGRGSVRVDDAERATARDPGCSGRDEAAGDLDAPQ